ncbi:MAG: hypothetical protein IJ751_05785, partial [Oscillospiraceae bacterium]|nr:hypothetical protein [Oscillospiraceae bacterium]
GASEADPYTESEQVVSYHSGYSSFSFAVTSTYGATARLEGLWDFSSLDTAGTWALRLEIAPWAG